MSQVVNFTAASFKKYDNVKIFNLVETLQNHNMEPHAFAKEIQFYFHYHAERKQNVIDCFTDQVLYQKTIQRKLMEDHERNNNWMPGKNKNELTTQFINPNQQTPKPLLILFIEHLNNMKRELR